MTDRKIIIQINDLRKSYKRVEVLQGINLEVEKGSIFALLGPNGAGKTTTIKILSTLVKPDSGTAILAGYDVVKDPNGVKSNISLTGQYAAIDELLTGKENLKMIGKLLHVKDRDTRIMELLERFDLAEAANRRVSTYSGGMKRKVDIAMSLMGNPNVLFLDEPTTGLDPQSRKAMWKMIKGLSESGVTIFLTTQYLDEAEQLADMISILNKGKIIAQGTTDELREIIPSDIIEIYLDSAENAAKAKEVLTLYEPRILDSKSIVRLETSGDVKELRDIFNKLDNAGIDVIDFEKKKASLEDVFLKIVGNDVAVQDE